MLYLYANVVSYKPEVFVNEFLGCVLVHSKHSNKIYHKICIEPVSYWNRVHSYEFSCYLCVKTLFCSIHNRKEIHFECMLEQNLSMEFQSSCSYVSFPNVFDRIASIHILSHICKWIFPVLTREFWSAALGGPFAWNSYSIHHKYALKKRKIKIESW